jgi:hypothetical protein
MFFDATSHRIRRAACLMLVLMAFQCLWIAVEASAESIVPEQKAAHHQVVDDHACPVLGCIDGTTGERGDHHTNVDTTRVDHCDHCCHCQGHGGHLLVLAKALLLSIDGPAVSCHELNLNISSTAFHAIYRPPIA